MRDSRGRFIKGARINLGRKHSETFRKRLSIINHMSFPWLSIELTNDCNKACSFCGRAKARAEGTMDIGYMDINLFEDIVKQFDGEIIQFNKDGEPLLYPDLWKVGYLCQGKITNIVTNGILLWERRKELEDFTSITVSVIGDDEEQYETVAKFVHAYDTPVLIKFLGDYDNPKYRERLQLRTTRRKIHAPQGDFDYQHKYFPVIPELNICLDFLMKPSIDWQGNFAICNRYDPKQKGVIANVRQHTLKDIWDCEQRQDWLAYHKMGAREQVPLCKDCTFYGVPTC